MSDFRRLKVWEKAHALTLMTYSVTRGFPREEMYGLTSQMRRAAVSIGPNIAEGTGRDTRKEMGYFIRIVSGSTHELQCHAMIGRDLGWIAVDQYVPYEAAIAEVRAMLHALRRSLDAGPRS